MTVTIDLRRRKTSLERSGLHSPLSAGATGPARAAQEKHLLLQLNASALGLHLTTLARFHVPVYMMSQNVRRLDVSFLPGRLWPAGREDAGKEGPAPPALAAAQVWLRGTKSQECSAPLMSLVLCCRLCLTLAEETRHGKKWPSTHRFQPGWLARRELHRRSTCCCSGTHLLLDYFTLHSRACPYICIHWVSECVPTRRVLSTSPSLAACVLGGGERRTCAARLGSCSGLALAGPAGDLKNALLYHCLACYVADCV